MVKNNIMFKKSLLVAGLVATMFSSGALLVVAQTEIETTPTVVAPVAAKMPMVLEVGPAGRALLRGTVSAVGTNSLTVKSWGGDWVVNVVSSTVLAPKAADMAQFVVGDFVGVQGVVSTSAAWTIDASLVRNWTARKEIKAEVKENKQEIRGTVKAMTARNWEGVASEVNADTMTFKLNVSGVTYDIKIATGAKIVNKAFMTLSFAGIKNGDTVRVYGPVVDSVITASVVRNVSVSNQ